PALPSISLHCARPHPPLPSFPTRRSSDLVYDGTPIAGYVFGAATMAAMLIGALLLWDRRAKLALAIAPVVDAETGAMASASFARSEEHTSELQSQSNLVCRLLLEKKKKKK